MVRRNKKCDNDYCQCKAKFTVYIGNNDPAYFCITHMKAVEHVSGTMGVSVKVEELNYN